jgi:hypothetical protein
VAAAAAAKIIHGTSSTSSSSSSYSRQLSQGAAAAAADARAVLCAVIRGLEPAEPQLMLLLQAVQQLQPGLAGLTAGSTAELVWKQQLQQLLLEAYSGTALPATTLADLIYRSMCTTWRLGQDGSDAVHTPSTQQQQVLDAAAAVLAALPAQQLQKELHTLLCLHQETAAGPQGRVGPPPQHQAVLGSILAATAAVAEPAQAAAMLAVLSMPFWADAWATFVSPAAGSFCWSRQQLVSTMQGIYPSAAAVAAAGGASSIGNTWGQLQAAWEAVAAHFNLQEVVAEVSTRPRAPATFPTGPDSTYSGIAASSPVQPTSKPFDSISNRPYSYRPGVPFSGDGWDQDEGPTYPAPAVACFSGTLGALVSAVLSSAPLPVAAAHIAALAEALPAQAFARVAAVLVPRLVSALDTLGTTTAWEIPTASATLAGPAWGSPSTASGVSTGLGQHSLGNSLLKLYGSLPELPEAPYAMQLLATAAPHLPLDRLPQLITTASRLASQLREMPWLPGAHCLSSREGVQSHDSYDSSPEPTAISQLELVVAAAASGRDSMGLQHMLAMMVRQLPLKEAHVAFRVLQGLQGFSPSAGLGLGAAQVAGVSARTQLPYTAVEEASCILRQRCDDTSAAAAGAVSDSGELRVVPKSVTPQGGEVVWQLGQSAAAAETPAAAREALGSFVQGWGSTPAADAADNSEDSSSGGQDDADREVVRRLAEIVSDMPHAPPAGSWPMDAMHVSNTGALGNVQNKGWL